MGAASSRAFALTIAPILGLGALLRLYRLPDRGLIYWDEAKFALEGIRLEALIGHWFGGNAPLFAGKAIGTAKPTHALLIAAAYGILGIHDYAPLALDALASIIGIGLTCGIGCKLSCRPVGLLAALFLAVSEYDVVYARSALSESDATTIFLGGVFLWLCGRESTGDASTWTRLGAGTLYGLAFTTNYRLLVYVGAAVAIDLTSEWRRQRIGRALYLGALWVLSCLAAPAAWQVVDFLARSGGIDLFRSEGAHRTALYLQEALYQIHQGKQSVVRFQPLPYLQWYALRDGWLALALLILGLTLTAWRRTYSWFVPAVLVVIPYLAYVTAPFIVPRNMDAALPFATLLEAAAVVEAYQILMRWERNKGRTGRIHEKANGAQPESRREVDRIGYGSAFAGLAMLALVLLRSVFPAWRAWEIGNERSGYATAARFALRHDGGKALTGTEVVVFYLRGNGLECTAPRLPFWRPRLDAAIRDGFDYAILDRTVASSLDGYVRRHAHLVARYSALGDVRTGENLIASENTYPPNVYQPPDIVSVYDLRQLPLGPRRSPPVSVSCDRDYPA